MGQKFLGSNVGCIASELGSQVSRQLLNYKNEKYGNTRISVFLRADELEEKMWLGLSMTAMEFVTSTLERIYGNNPFSCSDFINFSRQLNDFHPTAADNYVRFLVGSPDDECCKLLSGLIANWVKGAAEKFPKTAAGLPNPEKSFQRELYQNKTTFTKKRMEQYKSVFLDHTSIENNIDRKKI